MRDWHDVFCRRQRPWYDFLSLLIMILHLLGHLSQIYFMILAIQTKLVDWRSTLGWGAETTAKGASSSLPLPPSSPAPYSLTSAYDGDTLGPAIEHAPGLFLRKPYRDFELARAIHEALSG